MLIINYHLNIFSGLSSGEPKESSNVSHEWSRGIAPYLNIWKKLNQNSKLFQNLNSSKILQISESDTGNALEMFASRECAFAIELVKVFAKIIL